MAHFTLPEPTFVFDSGTAPLLISIPHNGSAIPIEIAETMTDNGRTSHDTDWFLDRLYNVPSARDASLMVAGLSRYVIDLNRPQDDGSLYPGQTTTGLVPLNCFDGSPIYQAARAPTPTDIESRIDRIWNPWHDHIARELARIRDVHGVAVLLEAHSIQSVVPRLFPGVLPDFNFGTNNGLSCDSAMTAAAVGVLKLQSQYSHVVDGRFIGGYITRAFGDPENNIHAMQIELSQVTYMNEATLEWDSSRADRVQPVIGNIVKSLIDWATTC